MCLAILAINRTPDLPLVMIGNRDEFHARPTAGLHWWDDKLGVLAGRDLVAGGTWFGVSREGRFGLVTNFRERPGADPAMSRGQLLNDFFASPLTVSDFGGRIDGSGYAGFNLIIGELGGETLYVSNRGEPAVRTLPSGIYAVSNAMLDTPWPKLVRVRSAMTDWFDTPEHNLEALFKPLRDTKESASPDTPELDIPAPFNKALTAPFIIGENYGTRSTSVVTVSGNDLVTMVERRFEPDGSSSGETDVQFSLREPALA